MKPLKFSIFLKLIIVVVVFGFLINLSVFLVVRLHEESQQVSPKLHTKVENLFLQMVGSPPDTVKMKQFSQDLKWDIRFESHQLNFSTSPYVPTVEQLSSNPDFIQKFPKEDHFEFEMKERHYSVLKTRAGVFVVQPANPTDIAGNTSTIPLLIVLLTIVILSLYLILRWLFKPLKYLSSAVKEVGAGNYYLDIPVERSDELGELSHSIVEMASNIGNSIKTKEQLLLDVSHELRTPLTRIKLGLEVDSSKEKINEDVQEMDRMISTLLESYRTDSNMTTLTLSKVDIGDLIQDTIDEYTQRERLIFKAPAGIIEINIDPDKIQTVLRNLIDNALKYSQDVVDISLMDSRNSVTISVKDKGIGISEADIPKIFEPFYRSDQSRSRMTGGFGLGLSICKKIMDAHKASITVKSKLNEGTEVKLEFKK